MLTLVAPVAVTLKVALPPATRPVGLALRLQAGGLLATHRLETELQTGVDPLQAVALLAEHCTQAPVDRQTALVPEHLAAVEQATQAFAVVSQMGFVPLHWVLVRQPTQVREATSQTGVAPEH
jgi:hypothetical protein